MKKPHFITSEDGSIAVEAVIMIPLLVWAYLAMFTIFDSYRQYTTQQKAVYTISDLISRQATPLDAEFIDGLHSLFEDLSRTPDGSGLRVTVARYDLANEEYAVVWSRARGSMLSLASADVASWTDRLPVMPQDDQIIIVESTAGFTPLFEVGLSEQTINNFVFTRPRYANQLCYDDICS